MRETVVTVVIEDDELLMERRSEEKDVYPGFLMCPSGHIKKGETKKDALAREMKEELGIDVLGSRYLFSIPDIDPISGESFRHNFLYLESYGGKIESSEEAKELLWKTHGELEDRNLVTVVRKTVERLHREGFF